MILLDTPVLSSVKFMGEGLVADSQACKLLRAARSGQTTTFYQAALPEGFLLGLNSSRWVLKWLLGASLMGLGFKLGSLFHPLWFTLIVLHADLAYKFN